MKNELRKDYILDKYTIVAKNRNLTPKNFVQQRRLVSDPGSCPFCPHNSQYLPTIIEEVQNINKQWIIRVIPNTSEAVTLEGNPVLSTDNRYFSWASAYGHEEIIVESPNHYDDFGDLPIEIIELNIKKYIQRITELEKTPYTNYVALFKNQGFNAGSNSTHPHSQIMTLGYVPQSIIDEEEAIEKFKKTYNVCPYCDIENIEKNSFRRTYQTNNFVCFTSYSSDYPFEVRIYPRRHLAKIIQLSDVEVSELAICLKFLISKLNSLNYPPYNVIYINAPVESSYDFHFYVRIIPRLSKKAGFELITNTIINPISPEDAAKFYRGEL